MSSIIRNTLDLLVRTLSRPIITWVLNHKKNDIIGGEFGKLGKTLEFIGQNWNYYTVKINRKILKISNITEIKQLPKDKALEKGINLISEIFIYSLLIFIPIYEWRRQSKNSDINEQIEEEEANKMLNLIKELSDNNVNIEKRIFQFKQEYNEVLSNKSKNI